MKIDIQDIMSDFEINEQKSASDLSTGKPMTIWLPKEYKARYDRIQKMSRQRFSKKLREVIQAVIDKVDPAA